MMHRVAATVGVIALAGCGVAPGAPEPSVAPVTLAPVVTAAGGGDAQRVRNAVVLVPGFMGDSADSYFPGVREALVRAGFVAEIAVIDPFNTSAVRGAELQTFIEQLLANNTTSAARVFIIAHSQGGIDARWAATQIPDKIAAIATIGTPHHGTPVADVATGDLPGLASDALALLLDGYGALINSTNAPTDSSAAIDQLSTKAMASFNEAVLDSSLVAYYSIAGRADGVAADADCAAPMEPLFIAGYDTATAPINPVLRVGAKIIDDSATPSPTNDGLVPVYSAKWGTFLGCLPADHWDEQCQGGADESFDCPGFYVDLANWLFAQTR